MAKNFRCIEEVSSEQRVEKIGSMDRGSVKRYRNKPRKSQIEMACIEEVLRGVERYRGCYQASIEMHKNMNFQERKSMRSKQIR